MATRLNRWLMVFLVVSSAPATAWAHPGHGAVESGPAHYLTAPAHALPLAGVLLLMLAAAAMVLMARMHRAVNDPSR